MEKIRKWLVSNKIFFETVAAIALTVMSLIVSVGSLRVSRNSLEVSRLQLALSEAEVAPIFRLEGGDLYQGDLLPGTLQEPFTSGYEELINQGTPIHIGSLKATTFFRLSGKGAEIKWIPLADPINIKYRYDKDGHLPMDGTLAEFRESKSILYGYDDLLKKLYAECESKSKLACTAMQDQGFETILDLEYTDKFNHPKSYYFAIFSGKDVPDGQDDLKKIFDLSENASPRRTIKELSGFEMKDIAAIVQG